MKALYAMLLRECSARDFSAQPKASPAEVAAVEARLGVRLPESYREFALDVGSVFWPVQVFSLAELEHHGRFEQPAWFLPFASDFGGNDWGWDTRVAEGPELPIVFWDHEDPPGEQELAAPDLAVPFDEWLAGIVEGALREDEQQRWAELDRTIRAHTIGAVPYVPALEDVRDVETRMGVRLPADYVRFTTTLGSTEWPFVVVDGQDVEELTARVRRDHPELRDAIAFGRDHDGTPLAFRGETVVCPRGAVAESFLALLSSRVHAAVGTPGNERTHSAR